MGLIGLGLSTALGAYKYVKGRKQEKRGRRIREEGQAEFDRQPFQTPAEALQALSSAEIAAGQTQLPGQELTEQKFLGAAGGALQATREAAVTPQDILAGATNTYQNLYVNPLQNLRVNAAQRYDANQRNLQAQLGNVAQFRNQEWQQNVLMPYQRAMQTAGMLSAAGEQNKFSGISDIAGGISNFQNQMQEAALAIVTGGMGGGMGNMMGKQGTDNSQAPVSSPYVSPYAGQKIDSPLQLPGVQASQQKQPILNTNNLMQYYG